MDLFAILVNVLIACLIFGVIDYAARLLLPVTFHTLVRVVLVVFFLIYLLQLLAGFTGIKIGTL